MLEHASEKFRLLHADAATDYRMVLDSVTLQVERVWLPPDLVTSIYKQHDKIGYAVNIMFQIFKNIDNNIMFSAVSNTALVVFGTVHIVYEYNCIEFGVGQVSIAVGAASILCPTRQLSRQVKQNTAELRESSSVTSVCALWIAYDTISST